MKKALRWLLIGALVGFASFGSVAQADVEGVEGENVQEGDNENDTEQRGNANSGDAVAGQVTGVVSSGDTSVDATNRSEDVEVETGDASGENSSTSFVGQTPTFDFVIEDDDDDVVVISDVFGVPTATNVQEGDNEYDLTQDANAATGDAVGGQVIGVVTAAGGSADIVAANTSEDVEVETGDSEVFNDAFGLVGLFGATTSVATADIALVDAQNVQEGDNELDAAQRANSASGDGVAGQVLGVVSAGDTSLDATNHSEDVEVETGDTFAENDFLAFVGLIAATGSAEVADVVLVDGLNVQEGDNERDLSQDANATSGDAVAGQVAGVVTSAGGSADLVLANTSLDSEAESGEGDFFNNDTSFTGLTATGFVPVL